MKNIQIIVIMIFITLSSKAFAIGLLVEGGLHLGGDTLIEVSNSNSLSEKVKAGQMLSMAVGVHTTLTDTLQGRLSIGYKIDAIIASNANINFTRVPVELLVMSYRGTWMAGAGLIYHLSPTLKTNSPSLGLTGSVEMDDAFGIVLAYDYNTYGYFTGDWYIGGRATIINYKAPTGSVSGNSLGVVFGYLF